MKKIIWLLTSIILFSFVGIASAEENIEGTATTALSDVIAAFQVKYS